ncbi:Slp family lipoprotein [Frateuria aurantia]
MSMYRTLAVTVATAALAACASVPTPLKGTFTPVSAVTAQQGAGAGSVVRWGGSIIKTEPGAQETCFFVLARPLDEQARPKADGQNDTQGRFVACHAGFYDPEVFARGREITITGVLHGAVTQKVGDYQYPYPRVEANVVYLWPKYSNSYYGYGPAYYDPWWGWGGGPWGPWGWGGGPWGWGGGWGGGAVFIRGGGGGFHGGGHR